MPGLRFAQACSLRERPTIRKARKIARKEALLFWIKSRIRTCSISRKFPNYFKGSDKRKTFYSYSKVDPKFNPLSIVGEGRQKYFYVIFHNILEEVDGVSIFLKQAKVEKKTLTRGLSEHTMRTSFMNIGSILITVPKTQSGKTKCRIKVDSEQEELVRDIMKSLGIHLHKDDNASPRQVDKKEVTFWQNCYLE